MLNGRVNLATKISIISLVETNAVALDEGFRLAIEAVDA